MVANPEHLDNPKDPLSPQILFDRSRVSGLEMFKLLTQLSTAAVGVFFIALSTNVNPPLTHEQRFSVLSALSFMVFYASLWCVWNGCRCSFLRTWARTLLGKNPEANWKHRERANLVRKFFAYAAMISFLIGMFAAARYTFLRAPR